MLQPPGSQLLEDRFVLGSLAGAGGMGEVYRGTDLHHPRPVAIKLLRVSDPIASERFAREATTLSELVHPAIVKYVAHGVSPAGKPYIVMEWLEGETLEQRLRRGPL